LPRFRETREAARHDVFASIEGYYHRQPLHSALGYIPQNRQSAKPRLTSRERQVLDNLPARIEELRVLKAKLQSLLDDTGLYTRNPTKFADVSAAFAKAEAALHEAEGEWLRLAILREETGR
jgi:hypothetical protein